MCAFSFMFTWDDTKKTHGDRSTSVRDLHRELQSKKKTSRDGRVE